MRPPETEAGAGAATAATLPATPPAGFGQRTLADICQTYGLHPPSVIRLFGAAGIQAAAGKSLRDIADENKRSPQDLYELIRQAAASAA